MTTTPPAQSLAAVRGRKPQFLADRSAVVALVYLILLVLAAVLADLIVPTDPTETDLAARFQKPLSGGHLLGTDDIGRDMLARVIHSARVSLLAGAGSVGVALAIAVPLGIAAGYYGGRYESLLMRGVDFLLSIPPLVMVFAVAGILGPSLRNAIIALAVYFVPLFLRLSATESRRLRNSQLIEAARAVGTSDVFIMTRHVLPNAASPLIVQASISIGVAIIAESSLSFLGLGVRPPQPSWGIMLRSAFDFVDREAWMIFVPATAMALTVLAFNFLGDGLRRLLERRTG